MKKRVLCVVAHPDDEVLGLGGSSYVLSQAGHSLTTCILVSEADARLGRPQSSQLQSDTLHANQLLGMSEPLLGGFPNIRLNTVAHIELVEFVEEAILATQPDILVTHHVSDVNDDHVQVSKACQAAARLPQRRPALKPIESILYMEVLSSTNWGMPGGTRPFEPNVYVEIGESGLGAKLEALATYQDVMRSYPHPRSAESVGALATLRGSDSGLNLAEAFELGFHRVSPLS